MNTGISILGLAAIIVATGGFWTGTSAQAAEKPNVLFIAIDDLNDWVGPLQGHPQVQTPNMDRLASRGTTFLSAHCQSPLCNPSRTSLMSGLRPTTTGVYALNSWFRSIPELREVVSLPQAFAAEGYGTYTTGKIYHGGAFARGERPEFQKIGPGASPKPFPDEKLVPTPATMKLMDWGYFPHRDEEKGDWIVADWAVEQLEKAPEDEPFFLACGFFLPHVPCFATQSWFDLYAVGKTELAPILAGDRDDTPRFSWYTHWKLPEPRLKFLVENRELLNLTRSYLACISFVDSQVGRVLDALEKSGRADNTVVVLWSDHGWHLGEKAITGKNTLWDRSTRVPLIFAGPGVKKGAVTNRPAELLDIYPTLLELCGLPAKPSLDGLSLAPQLRDPAAPRERPAMTHQGPDCHGVRTEKWRYIRYGDGSEELYDMEKDPNEWVNLAGRSEFASVKEELAGWIPDAIARPVEGSSVRLLERKPDGSVFWQLEEIDPEAPIPEI